MLFAIVHIRFHVHGEHLGNFPLVDAHVVVLEVFGRCRLSLFTILPLNGALEAAGARLSGLLPRRLDVAVFWLTKLSYASRCIFIEQLQRGERGRLLDRRRAADVGADHVRAREGIYRFSEAVRRRLLLVDALRERLRGLLADILLFLVTIRRT